MMAAAESRAMLMLLTERTAATTDLPATQAHVTSRL